MLYTFVHVCYLLIFVIHIKCISEDCSFVCLLFI